MELETKLRDLKAETSDKLEKADHHKQTLANQLDKANKELK